MSTNSSRSPENLARARAALAAKHPPVPTEDRFWKHVNKTDSCWLWTAATIRGYGVFSVTTRPARKMLAHRYSFELHSGAAIPGGMDLCHRCDVRQCVNPDHLFVGTRRDNVLDMMQKERGAGQFTKQTHCRNGHEMATSAKIATDGHRYCYDCALEYQRQRRALARRLK